MPVDGWPRVVEHPLDDTRRDVLVAAVRLEHCALTLVRHELRRDCVILDGGRRAVPGGQRDVVEVEHVREHAARGMIDPHAVQRPFEVLRWNHAPNALDRRHRGAGTCLRVVRPRPAVGAVL